METAGPFPNRQTPTPPPKRLAQSPSWDSGGLIPSHTRWQGRAPWDPPAGPLGTKKGRMAWAPWTDRARTLWDPRNFAWNPRLSRLGVVPVLVGRGEVQDRSHGLTLARSADSFR